MQGHGSPVYDLAEAKTIMLDLFNTEVSGRRANVAWQPPIRARGTNPDGSAWIDLDGSEKVTFGTHLDIVSRSDGSVVTANVAVTRIDRVTTGAGAGHKRVTYSGAAIPSGAPASLAVRLARQTFGPFTAISVDGILIVQRVAPAASTYKGIHQRADWHLVWEATDKEKAAAADAQRAAVIKQKQYVDYTVMPASGATVGWFPLWRPTLHSDGTPHTSGGKIVATEENKLGPDAIAGWQWVVMNDPSVPPAKPQKLADQEIYNVPVLRPTEP
jgi:hypothetical protein